MTNSLKVGIVGLGLIGASIAKCLVENDYKIFGVAHSHSTLQKAQELNIFSDLSQDIAVVDGCDIVFVATPINVMEKTFQILNSTINRPCIITDVASIKAKIVEIANKTFDSDVITFIPGHPMAGTEMKGIDNSFSEMFTGAKWVLCPTNNKKKNKLDMLVSVINQTGADVVYANPYDHDAAVSLISHLPLLISIALMETINSTDNLILKELALYLAASGFRDTTRLASGNPELSIDMLALNYENVLKSSDMFKETLITLEKIIKNNPSEAMEKIEDVSYIRKQLYSQFGKNIFKGLSG